MKKWKKLVSAAVSAAVAGAMLSISAAAASIGDVCNALRSIGIPEAQIQSCMNYYYSCKHDANGVYHPQTGEYFENDLLIDNIYVMQTTIRQKLNEMFPSAPAVSTTAPQQSEQTTTTTAPSDVSDGSTAVTTSKPFINMTFEEKKAFLYTLTPEERSEYINSLSNEERNSLIKQLPAEDKAAIAEGFVDMMKQFGMNMSVDDISDGKLDVSVRDGAGNLVDSSSIGIAVDDTGWNLTVPFAVSLSALLISVGGITFLTLQAGRKKEDANV